MAQKGKEIEVAVAEVVDYLKVTGQFAPALREVIERKITAQAARDLGLKVTAAELQKTADAFRVVSDLRKASETEAWLSSAGISLEVLENYLETNILIKKYKDALERKAHKTKYLDAPGIKESVRGLIYQGWLSRQFK